MSTMTLEPRTTYRRPQQGSTVRLTRRGRAVVFAVALLVVLVVGVVGASMAGASGKGEALRTHTVTVASGMTLWDLASQAAHGGDVLDMEQEIKDLNGLSDGMLIVGQTLRIPS